MVDASSDGGPARLIDPLAELMGESTAMVALRAQVRRLVQMQSSARRLPAILLVGETGTGKGLLARAIHRAGPRATGPFQAINCAALPEHLVEAELFGFEPGAFTDARRAKPGLFEIADGGTLFLDEIGLLHEPAQAKLLTALEERVVRRLGATRGEAVDVSIIAASNLDLEAAARERRFREDLYHRLAVVTLMLPPLRERRPSSSAPVASTGCRRRPWTPTRARACAPIPGPAMSASSRT